MNAITSLKARQSRQDTPKACHIDDDASTHASVSTPSVFSVQTHRSKRGSLKERLAKGPLRFNDILSENQNFNFSDSHHRDSISDQSDDTEAVIVDRFFSPQRKRINSCHGKTETVERSVEPAASKLDDYQKKYKTEICKNFEFRGHCQWGDAVF